MARSRLFHQVRQAFRVVRYCEAHGLSTAEGLARVEAVKAQRAQALSRRDFLWGTGSVVAAATLGIGLSGQRAWAGTSSSARIAIIGGGLSGLVCADRLRAKGYAATIYEANTRTGGRVHTTRAFPGQTAELGGELIDNLHKTMLGYANEFNLLREDLGKAPGEKHFFFRGQRYSEAEVVDEYRQLVPRMRADLQAISGAPSFFSHTPADVALDHLSLEEYLATRGAGLPLIQGVLAQAYIAEYGLEPAEQSCLNMLLFLHLDNTSKFREYGVFSDERYHLVGGNDAIPDGIRARLPGPVNTGSELTKLARNASGTFELYFRGASAPELADSVVLTLPFSVLRRVTLDPSLGLSADKLRAINELGYGANVKTMVGFDGRPWVEQGGSGLVYADLPNLQTTWETNYSKAGALAVLTDYAGGSRGRALQDGPLPDGSPLSCNSCHNGPGGFLDIKESVLQGEAEAFLADLDRVYPGAKDRATLVNGKYRVRRGHWVSQRYSRGSYTAYQPGQFTGLAGLEGQSAGALKFAGEHANSFYEWQGFMEGACLSGIAAADELVRDLQAGHL
jgi:monoamine oxidase